MMIDYLLAKDGVCEGYAMVCDMKGQTFSHLAQVGPFVLRKMMLYIQVLFFVYYVHFKNASNIVIFLPLGSLTDSIESRFDIKVLLI